MSGRPKNSSGVNRLLDMVVEEVSLVDRAANKHRFLIVKRSEEMDETTTDTTTSPDETTAETTAETNPADGSEGVAPADTGDSSNDAADGAPLAVAVAALEGLTETVELLGTLGEDEAKPKLAELATELRGVSERLAQVAGGEGGDDGTSTDASDGTVAGDPAKDGAAFASVIEAVRATLQRVGGLLEAGDNDQTGDDSESDGSGSSADGALAEQVTALVTELRALTHTVKEQQQRLARLEKRSGLPNSAPSGEQRSKPEGEDVGWPLDLNRPYDRESVDKAISFHDV